MSARRSLVWNGEAISERMRAAQIQGINRTMAACVVDAKRTHSWQNQTGVLEGSVDIATYARPVTEGVSGEWGSLDVVYALAQELGATIRPVNAPKLAIPQEDGGVVLVDEVTLPARPFLRPAGDRNYPALARNISAAYRSGAANGR